MKYFLCVIYIYNIINLKYDTYNKNLNEWIKVILFHGHGNFQRNISVLIYSIFIVFLHIVHEKNPFDINQVHVHRNSVYIQMQ